MRGSKPGERRGGRQAGTPNKLTAQHKRTVVEIAQSYTAAALATLAEIMKDEKAPAAARATAANSLLDRAHGRPKQPVEHELDLAGLSDEQLGVLALALGAPPIAQPGNGGDREAPTAH